jgi:hypothetical protein
MVREVELLMCPACIGAAAWYIVGIASAGGATAFALKRSATQPDAAEMLVEHPDDGESPHPVKTDA